VVVNAQRCSLLHGYVIPAFFLIDIISNDWLKFSQIYTSRMGYYRYFGGLLFCNTVQNAALVHLALFQQLLHAEPVPRTETFRDD